MLRIDFNFAFYVKVCSVVVVSAWIIHGTATSRLDGLVAIDRHLLLFVSPRSVSPH